METRTSKRKREAAQTQSMDTTNGYHKKKKRNAVYRRSSLIQNANANSDADADADAEVEVSIFRSKNFRAKMISMNCQCLGYKYIK